MVGVLASLWTQNAAGQEESAAESATGEVSGAVFAIRELYAPGHFGNSYAEQASPRDMYGHLGPIIAADRLERTVRDLKAQGVTAIMAYSEGVFEDVNKAILAGLGSGRYATADAVLSAYARRYFGVDDETARQWAAWLKAWGKPFDVDTAQSAVTLRALIQKTPQNGWRLQQWKLKQQMFEAHRKIGDGTAEWTSERLRAVDEFWAAQERLHRGVWGLAPQRYILARRFTPLPWYRSWAKHQVAQAATIGKNQ